MRSVILSTLALAVPTCFAADDFAIRLDRAEAVGHHQAFHATGSSEAHMKMVFGGLPMPAKDEQLGVEVAGDREVMEVSATGQPTKLRVTIAKAIRSTAGQSTELLPAGAIAVIEKKDGKEIFTDGQGVAYPKEVGRALGIVLTVNDGQSNDDLIFGTGERKRIGDAWPIHADAASKRFGSQQVVVDPANVQGTATLRGTALQGGQECLLVEATMTMTGVGIPLPPGVTATSGTMVATMGGLFPTDLEKSALHQVMTMEVKVEAAGRAGQPGQEQDLSLSLIIKHQVELAMEPVALPAGK